MKNYLDINGNQINGEMTVERMFDNACKSLQYRIEHGLVPSDPKIKKLLKEAIKNRKEIIRVIKQSQVHSEAKNNDIQELHCIVLVEGKAVCLKSIASGVLFGEGGKDQIMFVYEKTYNRYNYNDFQTDFYMNGGLDSVWFNFNYNVA